MPISDQSQVRVTVGAQCDIPTHTSLVFHPMVLKLVTLVIRALNYLLFLYFTLYHGEPLT